MQLKLTFGNDPIHRTCVDACVNGAFEQLPLEISVAEKLSICIRVLIDVAMAQAYPASQEGLIELSIRETHGKLEIQIRDFGMPKDVRLMEQELEQGGLPAENRLVAPALDVADEFHWLSFGPEGKALRIVKWLHDEHVEEIEKLAVTANDVSRDPDPQYAIRRMQACEAEQVSQLMYRIYGKTYFNADVYYPDRVASQNERGVVLSYVAVCQDGQVAGHYALERNQRGPVVEVGQAVVDPAHRGRGLLDRMKDHALKDAQHLELIGWYADAVTVHTFTQKSNAAHGGQITAVDLAIAPKSEHFDGPADQRQRVTCLMYFHWIHSQHARVLHVPTRHQARVGEIYGRLQCPVEFREGQSPIGPGTLEVKVDTRAARASLYAETIGEDTVHQVCQTRRELVEQAHLEVVYVDLPLEDPACAIVAEQLEKDGFGFLGIAPHFSPRGDILRLGYLVEPVVQEAMQLFDEIAEQMVNYALSDQERVRSKMQ